MNVIKVRHFLLSDVTFGADGDFSEKKLVESSNAKLANEPRSGIRAPVSQLALERTRTQLHSTVFQRYSLHSYPPRLHAVL